MKKEWLPHLALVVVNLMYGLNFVIAKDVMPTYIEPSGLILVRVLGATAFFWLLDVFTGPQQTLQKADIARMALCAVFGVALNQLLFFIGLNMSTPINAAIMMTSNPVIVLLMSALLISIPITGKKLAGIILGAGGATALILFTRGGADFSSRTNIGNLLVLLNSASYAIYIVISKPLMAKYHPLFVVKWVFFMGLWLVLPFGWNEFSAIQWAQFPPIIWAETAFIILGVTVVTYLFNIYALKYVDPSVVSIYIYLQPVIAAIHAILTGVDELTWVLVVCTAFIFSGVYLVSAPGRKKMLS